MKPAALVREETDMHIASLLSRWNDIRARANTSAYQGSPYRVQVILTLVGYAVDMASKEGKYRIRVGKFLDLARIEKNVIDKVILSLEADGYTVIKSFKAGKVSGLMVSWVTKVFD